MEEIDKIRLKLAKANDANENTNNSGKDYMAIRDSLTDIALLLCRVERAVGECTNENSGLNIPVVVLRSEQLCLDCQQTPATHGIGDTKTLCKKCWNKFAG